MKIIKILFVLIFISPSLFAQLELSLPDILKMAKAKNITVQQIALQTEMAQSEWQKQKEWWLPDLFIGTTLHHLTGNAMNGDGGIFKEVDRQNRWLGGEIQADWDFGTGLYLSKAAKLKAESVGYGSAIQKNEAIIQTVEAYYALLVAQSKYEVIGELIDRKKNLIEQLEVQTKYEMRIQSELLLAKSNQSRLSVNQIKARQEQIAAQNELARLLRIADPLDIVLVDSVLVPLNLVDVDTMDFKMEEHPSIKQNELMMESLKKQKQANTTGLLIPDGGVRFSAGPFGDEYSDLNYTNNLQAYIGWKIPLGQLFYKGDTKRLDAQIKMAEWEMNATQEQISSLTGSLLTQLDLLKQQMQLAEESSGFASQALEQSLEREKLGLGTSFEVLQAQEEYLRSQIQYIEILAEYNVFQYRLLVAKGIDL